MSKRIYFKYRIAELEELFADKGVDIIVLKDLKNELLHRKTHRAVQLLVEVKKTLRGLNTEPSQETALTTSTDQSSDARAPELVATEQKPYVDATEAPNTTENPDYLDEATGGINWDEEIEKLERDANDRPAAINGTKAIENKPENLLDTWTIIEALSPQSYLKARDLVVGKGGEAEISSRNLPWPHGKSRPGHKLFYTIYLGALDLAACTKDLLEIYKDDREERPYVQGKAAMAAVVVDRNGVPVGEDGLAISSFGWAYSRALSGNLNDLKYWDSAEKILLKNLEKILYRYDDGQLTPVNWGTIMTAYDWLVKNCAIPQRVMNAPEFVIKRFAPFSIRVPEAPLLNSFYLADLQNAKTLVLNKRAGLALRQYLGIETPSAQYDLLEDDEQLKNILEPKNMPLGRWPVRGRYPLVLLQQAAVNIAKRDLKHAGLFSVNGPPGTGKTTLLRDIVADVVVNRAIAMSAFDKPADAFTKTTEVIRSQGSKCSLFEVDESLKGYEILVASSNSKAVENISKELPLRDAIDDSFDLNYFKPLCNSLVSEGEQSWGLIATVLGNAANKSNFASKAWWDYDTSLRSYFKYIAGSLEYEEDEDGNEKIPSIVAHGEPPRDLQEALENWRSQRKQFEAALNKIRYIRNAAQEALKSEQFLEGYQAVKDDLEHNVKLGVSQISEGEKSIVSLKQSYQIQRENLALDRQTLREHDQGKPGFWKKLFFRSQWGDWQLEWGRLTQEEKNQQRIVHKAEGLVTKKDEELQSLHNKIEEISSQLAILEKQRQEALRKLHDSYKYCGLKLVNDAVLDVSHNNKQIFSPTFTKEAHDFRDEIFVLAIKLHKAFIDAAYRPISQNLVGFMRVLGNKKLPNSGLLSDIWSTGFIVSPVFSTAFASINRMLNILPSESIGWLLIDEAGQATPQQAVGAIMRSKRVMAVGDPLQIEPVVSTPLPLLEGIASYMGVNSFDWVAPDASVQALADRANRYGATIDRDLSTLWIGAPLLVHRRCEDPMFTISNKLAYNGKMVKATKNQTTKVAATFGGTTKWFDVAGTGYDKWCPASGDLVAEMILKSAKLVGEDLDLFVISPFRIVAQKMRGRMRSEIGKLTGYGIKNPSSWITQSIGTVHTFQGKESETVILLLGAPNTTQSGARNWAAGSANLMNVAVSRAKRNFYVVGNKFLWAEAGKMPLIVKEIRKHRRSESLDSTSYTSPE